MFNKRLLEPILEEYLKKFPENALEDVRIELKDDGIFILIGGALPSLRVANVIINVLLRHVIKGESNKFVIYDVSLAIEETIMNVFHHDSPENLDQIEVNLRFSSDNIYCEITDHLSDKAPIDFPQIFASTPGHKFSDEGRDILLIKKAVDTLDYEFANQKNILRFTKSY